MYENTNEKGVLNIPGWYYLNEHNYSLRRKIKWDYKDLVQVIFELNELQSKIEKIACIYREAGNGLSKNKDLLPGQESYPFYTKFFMPFRYLKGRKKSKIWLIRLT